MYSTIAHAPSGVWAFLWCSNWNDPMNTIHAFGQPYEVPCSNGQLENDPCHITPEDWAVAKAQVEGRIAAPISPCHKFDLAYLQSYIKGTMASIDARLLIPDHIATAEVEILYLWAMYTGQVLRRLRKLDEDMAQVDEW